MAISDSRRMVIIKNINSNIIEEAILILKKDTATDHCNTKGINYNNNRIDKSIIKEAETIINNYEKECKLRAKNKYFGRRSRLNLKAVPFINALLVVSIALLVFLVLKGL